MKIQIGRVQLGKVENQAIIPNKTRKYLLPCLKEYGDEFMYLLNNVFKVAVGLGDIIVKNTYFQAPERHLFILLDYTIATPFFISFLEFIRDKEYYEDDYVYGNIQKSKFHMVVIKFPEKYYDSFDTFKEGKYSKMFDKETIARLFNSKDNLEAPLVLIKDHNYNITFTNFLNSIFRTTLKPGEYEGELDLPPKEKEEEFE